MDTPLEPQVLPEKDPKEFMVPFVIGATALLWGKTLLELTTRGELHSPDNAAQIYLLLVGAYAGAGEAQKWWRKDPWNPQYDPWLERAQRGGVLVALWLGLLAVSYLWRIHDTGVPMPHELIQISQGLIVIFFAKNASRTIRHTRRGVGGGVSTENLTALEPDSSTADNVYARVAAAPDPMSMAELCAAFPDFSARHIRRAVNELLETNRLESIGPAGTRASRYRTVHPSLPIPPLPEGSSPAKN